MKSRNLIFIAVAFVFTGCTKNLDLTYFSIDIPSGWSYEPGEGTDSFNGTITTSSGSITFDYSTKGYANSLALTEQQFLADPKNWKTSTCYFCKPGVTYVPKDSVDQDQKQSLLKPQVKGIPPAQIEAIIEYSQHIHRPDMQWQRYYPGADYIADLKYQDSTIYVPIYIPKIIKNENIHIDTTEKYIIKTVWPKIVENGITGVYIKSRTSQLNFNIKGADLTQDEQEKALKAFKTIKLKE
jgi:hypothetical protein